MGPVVIFKVGENGVEGSVDNSPCGSDASKCELLRFQAGWDVVLDVR